MASGQLPDGLRLCEAQTLDGKPCRAPALRERPFCLAHDPERREDAQAARSAGAQRGNRLRSLRGRRSKLDSMSALVAFVAKVIYDAAEGELDYPIARTVLYGISIQRQLVEASDLDRRLTALEDQLQRIGPRARAS